tara:strand:- start:12089 stop:12508 length:420 start_codon:yes stop_codon:yes gene_type:complete
MTHQRLLQLLLRIAGSFELLALVFVFAPESWMRDIHVWLGLGQLPDTPITWYLTRSLSAFYALTGGLFWILSSDIRHYHSLLFYVGCVSIGFGFVMTVVDLWAGMPASWTLTEGPIIILMGVAMVYLLSRMASTETEQL